ncbi:MAG TPA: sce7726 family protein [Thermoanaerobaculaceae bacterium]|nr:sce7726 family protein [Thermoanaerobaculaceae bacterium]
MRDVDVRQRLLTSLRDEYATDPQTKIIEELGIRQGSVRIDVAVVNGRLDGFEIKSDRDNLDRLPEQARLYSTVFDRLTLVVGEGHLAAALALVPEWWGITTATSVSGKTDLQPVRAAAENPGVDPLALVELLWRDEALAILEGAGRADGLRSKPRSLIWRRLAQLLPLDELRAAVRRHLTSRVAWRADPAQMPDGG